MKRSLSFPDTPHVRLFLTGTYKGQTIYLIIQPAAANPVIIFTHTHFDLW